MKRIIVSVAIVLAIILMTLTLQSCFTPYPALGTPERESKDRELREQYAERYATSIDGDVSSAWVTLILHEYEACNNIL